MKVVLVTGAGGFIGRHVVEALKRRPDVETIPIDIDSTPGALDLGLQRADAVIHLAGVNRPLDPADFRKGNTDFTSAICEKLRQAGRDRTVIVLTSSIQALLDNPYGVSKREAERCVQTWAESPGGGNGVVFRLKNVFGKWCRPNYNSVVATFCHNVAHDLPIAISDSGRVLELSYIDDVVESLLSCVDEALGRRFEFRETCRSHAITLGALAELIRSFRASRSSLMMPSFEDEFTKRLYATYLSYLDPKDFAYRLDQRADARGSLAEFMKSTQFGQIFVSRTKPGVTRGNHFHHTKTEKFFVVEGDAVIRFRPIGGGEIVEHRVSGREFRVVDIPPGYAHSIENVGMTELVTLFWASEIFDPEKPDVYFQDVL